MTTDVEAKSEQDSKDAFFKELADIAQRMIEAHGKDFSMGALVLAARFIAEGRHISAKFTTQ